MYSKLNSSLEIAEYLQPPPKIARKQRGSVIVVKSLYAGWLVERHKTGMISVT